MTTPLQKVYATLVTALVLGLQLWAIIPRRHSMDWYWPFTDYRMYAVPHFAGDVFRHRELRVVPCETGHALPVKASDLGVEMFRFFDWLSFLADTMATDPWRLSPDSVASHLDHLIGARWSGAYCAAQVWQREVVIGAPGPVPTDPPWRMVHAWILRRRPPA